MTVTAYHVVRSPSIADLNREVTAHIDSGWQPLGKPGHRTADGWYQAVVKYAKESAEDETIQLEVDHAQAIACLLEPDASLLGRIHDVDVQGALHAVRRILLKANKLVG